MALLLAAACGCSGRGASSVPSAAVDGDEAAAALIAELDDDGNGAISQDEAKALPPLARAFAAYDPNRDGALAADEIAARLQQLYGPSVSLTAVQCSITQAGRPLSGAKVVFRPPAMLGDSVKTAEGTTDELGMAAPSLPEADLPERLKGAPLMYPGLYLVEVTHPQLKLPAKYNTATELGCEIDPAVRGGANVAFDLKP
ncbi:MAG: hypothetical protein DCC67_07375 [Planctomycetota bacterium]|nr:MAG: hypothetical protein DCC67_07375 [Planctomycetota bacterium]